MPSYVVIVSRQDDIHAFALKRIAESRNGPLVKILDTSLYPDAGITVTWEHDTPGIVFGGSDQIEINAETSIWWRRPQAFVPSFEISDPRMRQFVVSECETTLDGLIAACGCFAVNDPFRERRANNKILQLQAARRVGFLIPETCITNSPITARSFFDIHSGKVVFKAQTDAKYHLGETRIVDEQILEREENIKYCPVQFQWFVPSAHDIRATVVGDSVFASRIESGEESSPIDWRLDLGIPMKETKLSNELSSMCIELTRTLGLAYGAIDLRVTPDGRVFFFEINPSGQFLFCDSTPDLPITSALYELLSDELLIRRWRQRLSAKPHH